MASSLPKSLAEQSHDIPIPAGKTAPCHFHVPCGNQDKKLGAICLAARNTHPLPSHAPSLKLPSRLAPWARLGTLRHLGRGCAMPAVRELARGVAEKWVQRGTHSQTSLLLEHGTNFLRLQLAANVCQETEQWERFVSREGKNANTGLAQCFI